MSEVQELGDNSFSKNFMISKLITNLLARFYGFVRAWKRTLREDHTLPNLKFRLCKEETKILHRIQPEIAPETKALYPSRGRFLTSGSQLGNTQQQRLYLGMSPSGYLNTFNNLFQFFTI